MLFNLAHALEYSKDGNFEETAQLEVDAPNFTTLKESAALSQCFVKALFSSQRNLNSNDNDNQHDGNTEIDRGAVQLLLMASDVSFNSVVSVFSDLCCKSCTLDHERKINLRKEHFARISYDDILSFVCEYIATFIAPSMLSGLQSMDGQL